VAAAFVACAHVVLTAHDVERTRVSLTFSRDGSFVLDVSNDPDWLKLRLERFTGPFSDRVVLWVDGREIRPASVEYIPPAAGTGDQPALATYRMRGTMPLDARTLRWYYGLVIDPYPLTIRRADGKIVVDEIGQFAAARAAGAAAIALIAAALLIPLALRLRALSLRR